MIFVDAGAWFASLIPTDPDHASATAWLAENSSSLLTTDYVIDETLTLGLGQYKMTRDHAKHAHREEKRALEGDRDVSIRVFLVCMM
jgi:predicted nucleic acid-binding protein